MGGLVMWTGMGADDHGTAGRRNYGPLGGPSDAGDYERQCDGTLTDLAGLYRKRALWPLHHEYVTGAPLSLMDGAATGSPHTTASMHRPLI